MKNNEHFLEKEFLYEFVDYPHNLNGHKLNGKLFYLFLFSAVAITANARLFSRCRNKESLETEWPLHQ